MRIVNEGHKDVMVVSVVTAAVIGAWNLVSVALEYLLLILIYRFPHLLIPVPILDFLKIFLFWPGESIEMFAVCVQIPYFGFIACCF